VPNNENGAVLRKLKCLVRHKKHFIYRSPQKALYLITFWICGRRHICKKRRVRRLAASVQIRSVVPPLRHTGTDNNYLTVQKAESWRSYHHFGNMQ